MREKFKVLFLDIDGVLNSNHDPALDENRIMGISPRLMPHLNRVLLESGAKVVISSTWRLHHKLSELRELLVAQGFEFPERVIDATGVRFSGCRGHEIAMWLDDHKDFVTEWAIVDDTPDMLESQFQRFVQTDYSVGLTEENVGSLIKLLNESTPTNKEKLVQ